MKMKPFLLFVLLFASVVLRPGRPASAVEYDAEIPQLAFAAQELENAMKEAGREDLQVRLTLAAGESSAEAFQIRLVGPNQVEVTGSDAKGAMYGGLEVADVLRLGLPIENQQRAPFVRKRGIKFNIPLDARTPSYDDTGDAAQKNIETIWDFEFWKAYLDDLARYRYNVLSLWSTHPYPSLIQLDEYPDVALDDVYRVAGGVFQPHHKNRLQDVDLDEPGTLQLVKTISIEDKIAHWQRVFQYAEDRGIEIYLFHWNVMTFGATGKHGITPDQTNAVTIDYMRKCVRQALLTYPQIAGIEDGRLVLHGVIPGKSRDRELLWKASMYKSHGSHYATLEKGQLVIYRGTPDRPGAAPFRTPPVSGPGPYKLGITVSRKLVIVREVEGQESEIVWEGD